MHEGRKNQGRDRDQEVVAHQFPRKRRDAARIANQETEDQGRQEQERADDGQRQKNVLHGADPKRSRATRASRRLNWILLIVIVVEDP